MPSASSYSRSVVLDALGIIGMFVFCACVIALAAGITWLVVRYSPAKRPGQP
jgi:hypothetical protein